MSELAEEQNKSNNAVETTIYDKYLTFAISEHTFGLPINDIIEIVSVQKATVVPNTPNYVKGVINLRGQIVPLIDVNLRFGNPETEYTERTCVIVVEIDGEYIGLIVNYVYEVLDILEISAPPENNQAAVNKYVSGIAKVPSGEMALLLDTRAVIGLEEEEMELQMA